MAKPNYSFAKRQRELAKKKKKEEKRQRKAAEREDEGESLDESPLSESIAPESSDSETTPE